MDKALKQGIILAVFSLALLILPSASKAPALNKKKRVIDYISDYQVAEYEKYGIEQELGKMVKHRDESGNITTISWDQDED